MVKRVIEELNDLDYSNEYRVPRHLKIPNRFIDAENLVSSVKIHIL